MIVIRNNNWTGMPSSNIEKFLSKRDKPIYFSPYENKNSNKTLTLWTYNIRTGFTRKKKYT